MSEHLTPGFVSTSGASVIVAVYDDDGALIRQHEQPVDAGMPLLNPGERVEMHLRWPGMRIHVPERIHPVPTHDPAWGDDTDDNDPPRTSTGD